MNIAFAALFFVLHSVLSILWIVWSQIVILLLSFEILLADASVWFVVEFTWPCIPSTYEYIKSLLMTLIRPCIIGR